MAFSQRLKAFLFAPKKSPLPRVALPYDQELKRVQKKYFFSFLILLGFAVFSTYFYAEQKAAENKWVNVLVFASDITTPKVLETADFEIQKIQQKQKPQTAISKVSEAVGQVILRPVVKNERVLISHIQKGLDPESVSAQFSEYFAFTMGESWFVSQFPDIKRNDILDILVSNPQAGLAQTTPLATQVRVIEIQKGRLGQRSVVVNMTEEESRAVLFARGLRLPMQILVHSSIGKKTKK